jgi:hypothetical protein
MVVISSTFILKSAIVDQTSNLSMGALADHGLDDELYVLCGKSIPTDLQRAMLVARLHELLIADNGEQTVDNAVRNGKLRHLLGRQFNWVCPLLECNLSA